MYFPHKAIIERTQKSGTKYTYAVHGSSTCFLQPLDSEQSQLNGVTFGKSARVYFPYGTNVLDSDRITINNIKYGIKGFNMRDYGGLPHIYAVVEQV
jgi:hypothetical protein